MSKLTTEQKKAYIARPNHCPFCGSNNIDTDTIEQDGISTQANVRCESCEEEWRDIYTLTDIETD